MKARPAKLVSPRFASALPFSRLCHGFATPLVCLRMRVSKVPAHNRLGSDYPLISMSCRWSVLRVAHLGYSGSCLLTTRCQRLSDRDEIEVSALLARNPLSAGICSDLGLTHTRTHGLPCLASTWLYWHISVVLGCTVARPAGLSCALGLRVEASRCTRKSFCPSAGQHLRCVIEARSCGTYYFLRAGTLVLRFAFGRTVGGSPYAPSSTASQSFLVSTGRPQGTIMSGYQCIARPQLCTHDDAYPLGNWRRSELSDWHSSWINTLISDRKELEYASQ
jgi:hypothetical protein